MLEQFWHYPLLVLVGFLVGFINTISGGASLISLPILLFMGMPAAMANGTNRVAILVQTAMGVAGFKSKGVSTFPFNIYLGIAAFIGALIGAQFAVDIDPILFKKILAWVMLTVVSILIFKPKTTLISLKERITGKYLWAGMVVFFFLGIYGGFLNAGIGFLIIMWLHIYHRMNLVRVNATKVASVFIYTLAALFIFLLNGKINWGVGLVLALGQGTGAWFASRLSVKKGDGFIKVFLIVMIVVMSIKLLWDAY